MIVEKAPELTLQAKLAQISELEDRHRLLGVSFAVKPGAMVLTEESADHVIKVIETAVQDLAQLDSIPTAVAVEPSMPSVGVKSV